MKVLLDSSVLVAAFVESHPRNEPAAALFGRIHQKQWTLFVAAHSLAETYSVMTGTPFSPRISPSDARGVMSDNLEEARIVPLTGDDYLAAIDLLAGLGLSGGAVFDALIFRAAQNARVDRIFTFNAAHFLRFAAKGKPDIVTP
ncbi:MAG: PIN domain-containing protein [Planctomycetota bacterium]